jgi:hypothetical protein
VAVDYQARADACPERDEENVATPARGSDLKLAISGRIRVIIYDDREIRYARQLCDYVYLRQAGKVRHDFYTIRPSVNKTWEAQANARGPPARALIVAQSASGFGYLFKQGAGVLLLSLFANFV